jgi:hypothetical protein
MFRRRPCVLKNKQDGVLDKDRMMDNVQKHNICNKTEPLHVLANDGHHRKVTNTSNEVLQVYYMHVLSCKV